MSDAKLYTDRSNARRSAEAMLAKADAPALDYTIAKHETASGYRYEIVWKTVEPAIGSDLAKVDATTDEDIARQIAEDPDTAPELTEEEIVTESSGNIFADLDLPNAEERLVEAQAMAADEPAQLEGDIEPDLLPAEAAPTMAARYLEWHKDTIAALPQTAFKPKRTTLPMADAVAGAAKIGNFDSTPWERNERHFLTLTFADASTVAIAADDEPAPSRSDKPKPIAPDTAAKSAAGWEGATVPSSGKVSTNGSGQPKTRGKRASAPALKPGEMPAKPVVTSAANKSYQAKFDALAALAEACDSDGVAGYEVKGVNTYAKAVTRYRDALLASRPEVA